MKNTKMKKKLDATIHYDVYRQPKPAPWVMLVHGLGGDLTAWEKEREYLHTSGLSTVAIDLRGHGLSARSDEKDFYSFEHIADDIGVVMDTLGIVDMTLIGHCFGGMISLLFSAAHQKRIAALILVDTSYKPPYVSAHSTSATLLQYIFDFLVKYVPDIHKEGHVDFQKFVGTADYDIRRFSSDLLHTSLHSYLRILSHLMHYDGKKLLDRITAPTLIISGTNDSIFPPEIAKYIHDRIKGSELALVSGANHIVVLNNPDDLNVCIGSFLRRIDIIKDTAA